METSLRSLPKWILFALGRFKVASHLPAGNHPFHLLVRLLCLPLISLQLAWIDSVLPPPLKCRPDSGS